MLRQGLCSDTSFRAERPVAQGCRTLSFLGHPSARVTMIWAAAAGDEGEEPRSQETGGWVLGHPPLASRVILSFFTSDVLASVCKMRVRIPACTVAVGIQCEDDFTLRSARSIGTLAVIVEASPERVIDLSIVPPKSQVERKMCYRRASPFWSKAGAVRVTKSQTTVPTTAQ